MWQYSHFLSTSSCLWAICCSSAFKGSCPNLYPFIRPPINPLALGRGRILIPGFIRSPPKLAVYDVPHSLLLGGVDMDFPFTEDETRRHFSYLSGNFGERFILYTHIFYLVSIDSEHFGAWKGKNKIGIRGKLIKLKKVNLWLATSSGATWINQTLQTFSGQQDDGIM